MADWARIARRSLQQAEDPAAYLARLRRLRAAGEPNMALDSPLWNDMYRADMAYENLASGKTANLRHAGGDLARIAGEAIRDSNAAARQARSATALDRALAMDPDGVGRYALPLLAGGMAAGGGGIALQNAIEERRRREADLAAEWESRAPMLAEMAAQRQVASEAMNNLDGWDPVASEIVDQDAEEQLLEAIAAQSYPPAIRPRSPEAVEGYTRKLGLPTFPGTVIEESVVPRRR